MAKFAGSLDTNMLLRLMLNDVPTQHILVKELLEQSVDQFTVADTAVIELAFVLDRHYGFTRPQIAEAIESLMKLGVVNCNRMLFERVNPLFIRFGSLSFEDCCLAVYAHLNDAEPLWTFDKKLANQAPGVKLLS